MAAAAARLRIPGDECAMFDDRNLVSNLTDQIHEGINRVLERKNLMSDDINLILAVNNEIFDAINLVFVEINEVSDDENLMNSQILAEIGPLFFRDLNLNLSQNGTTKQDFEKFSPVFETPAENKIVGPLSSRKLRRRVSRRQDLMKYITDQISDTRLNLDLLTFVANADKHRTILKISNADYTALVNAAGDFSTALTESNNAKAALKSAVSAKNAERKDVRAIIAKHAQTWRADQSIPNSILEEMMVPTHETQGSRTPPTQPLNLSLKVDSVGMITLKWDKNGNKASTVFMVETSDSATGEWTVYDATTKSRVRYQGTPGTEVWFRVSAKRNGLTSPISLAISLWANGGGRSFLEVAA